VFHPCSLRGCNRSNARSWPTRRSPPAFCRVPVRSLTSRQRLNDATGTGALRGPSGSHPKSRDSYAADAPAAFYETTAGWVQGLPMAAQSHTAVFDADASPQTVFDWLYRDTPQDAALLAYPVDDAYGTLGGMSPLAAMSTTDAALYRQAAAEDAVPVFTPGQRADDTAGRLRNADTVLDIRSALRANRLVRAGQPIIPVGMVDRVVNEHARFLDRGPRRFRRGSSRLIQVDAVKARLARQGETLRERELFSIDFACDHSELAGEKNAFSFRRSDDGPLCRRGFVRF